MKRSFQIAGALLLLLAVYIRAAPQYLQYRAPSNAPQAVVVLLGRDWPARKRQAEERLRESPAKTLIIPAYGRMRGMEGPGGTPAAERTQPAPRPRPATPYPRYFEDTHIEMLKAKSMMDTAGIAAADFVSSPYHMRRIRLIADRVFDSADYRLGFVPTPYDPPSDGFWLLQETDRRWVVTETVKILWFLCYSRLA